MEFNVSSRVYVRVLVESPANCRNGSDSNTEIEVVQAEVVGTEVVETEAAGTEEENHNSRAEYIHEYMQKYQHRRRLTAEIEVAQAEAVEAEVVGTEVVETEAAETEEENHNSQAEYMCKYRCSRQSRAVEENERVNNCQSANYEN
ncbi:hypothetical protein PHYBLDRAFT_167195 [Phycomyces blakesleeanus NRRL 1555(-)]|uniref:Uncharacterized protein n=1 Tax=Phycomyces blakesleeanus (strain ATCC 8743b / DSM 1359 / FGSC 10004 / NBRC 33097 / NRRL 1555) TaxID=763407 RepID=A0A162UAT4_PHYB8|nr:hypothetical protein PHYBLDRAFT_167195 [Phycomyces blakesleeanus NRRL 1555(-)]OAD74852.1 hypothetical protein PHYBLDRAFT_167195 [Phycomyces blakesleeanus NRRL 1555(-)]|eukprot:XP_018292892.1 hypothetical protein PHYBLDRAFT_167195 [Phycomyces blakesleeanus NRRL 1555(-)]